MSQSGLARCTNSVLSGEPFGKIWSFLELLFTFHVFHADSELAYFALSGLSKCWTIDMNKNSANSHMLSVWHHLHKYQQKEIYYLRKFPKKFIIKIIINK